MKNKVYEKMREYGWNLNDNTNKDFENVYKIHYDFIEKCYDYSVENDDNIDITKLGKQDFVDMIIFMSDFLRAINDIDDTIKVGNAKISLYNSHNIPYALSNMCLDDTKEVEIKIRKCEFNGNKICLMLNSLYRILVYNNWEVAMETDKLIVLKGKDNLRNIVYLEIKK